MHFVVTVDAIRTFYILSIPWTDAIFQCVASIATHFGWKWFGLIRLTTELLQIEIPYRSIMNISAEHVCVRFCILCDNVLRRDCKKINKLSEQRNATPANVHVLVKCIVDVLQNCCSNRHTIAWNCVSFHTTIVA